MQLGERIRQAMAAKGMKHVWVADGAGITPATLSNIITGRTADPRLSIIVGIARVLGEPVGALLDDSTSSLLEHEEKTLRAAAEIISTRVISERQRLVASSSLPRRKRRTAHRVPAPTVAATPNREMSTDVREMPKREIPHDLRERGVRRVFRVEGESMIGAGINDGDLLYVKTGVTEAMANGRNVVCRVGDFQCVKRLVVAGGTVTLESANEKFPPVILTEEELANEFELYGIVVARMNSV
jgi:SOS-response transcriptional repressor LexA